MNGATGGPVRVVMLALAASTAAFVVGYGVVLGAPGAPLLNLVFLPVVLAALVAFRWDASVLAKALIPVTVGLVTVVALCGTFVGGLDTASWWVPGGLIAALPLLVLSRRPHGGGVRPDHHPG